VPRVAPRSRRAVAFTLALALGFVVWAESSAHAGSLTREQVLEQATSLTRAGEWMAVIALLEPAHRADPDSPEVALLLAIAYFREDRPGDAEPLFRELAAHPDDEIAEPSQLFLGLLARESGDEREARRLFREVADSSSSVLGESAQRLLRPAAGQRLTAALSLRSGIDSNVGLISSQTVGPGPSPADANLLVTGAAVAWPFAGTDFRLLAAGAYRKQTRLAEFDFGAARAGAYYEHASASVDLGLGYAFEASMLGGALLSTGHAGDLRARLQGREFAELAYALRVRSYGPDAYEGYSGDSHRGTLWLGRRYPAGEAALGGLVEAERTRDPDLAGLGAGAAGRLAIRHDRLSLRAHGELLPRRLGGRRDFRAEASASIAYAFADHLAWLVGASALANRSTAPEFQHVKAAGYAGLELRL
jgi:hypothetical protein